MRTGFWVFNLQVSGQAGGWANGQLVELSSRRGVDPVDKHEDRVYG